jgi:MFS family permease
VVGISIRAPFFVYAGTLALAALVAWRTLPSHPAGAPSASGTPSSAPKVPSGPPPPTFFQALRLSAYRAALAANLTNGFVTFGLRMSLVPLFIVEALQQSETWVGIAFLVAAVANVVVLTPGSRMSDRAGRRPAMLVGTIATAIGMLALALAGASAVVLVAMAVLGAASAFMGSAPAAAAGDIAGSGGKGSLIAGFQMTADFGAIVGPLVAGVLVDALGFTAAFLAGAAVSLFAALLAWAMAETLHTARA